MNVLVQSECMLDHLISDVMLVSCHIQGERDSDEKKQSDHLPSSPAPTGMCNNNISMDSFKLNFNILVILNCYTDCARLSDSDHSSVYYKLEYQAAR